MPATTVTKPSAPSRLLKALRSTLVFCLGRDGSRLACGQLRAGARWIFYLVVLEAVAFATDKIASLVPSTASEIAPWIHQLIAAMMLAGFLVESAIDVFVYLATRIKRAGRQLNSP